MCASPGPGMRESLVVSGVPNVPGSRVIGCNVIVPLHPQGQALSCTTEYLDFSVWKIARNYLINCIKIGCPGIPVNDEISGDYSKASLLDRLRCDPRSAVNRRFPCTSGGAGHCAGRLKKKNSSYEYPGEFGGTTYQRPPNWFSPWPEVWPGDVSAA